MDTRPVLVFTVDPARSKKLHDIENHAQQKARLKADMQKEFPHHRVLVIEANGVYAIGSRP